MLLRHARLAAVLDRRKGGLTRIRRHAGTLSGWTTASSEGLVAAINAVVPGANITLPEGRNPDRPPDNYLDTTRLQADTGFRPEYDVERAVPDYVDWLRRHDRSMQYP